MSHVSIRLLSSPRCLTAAAFALAGVTTFAVAPSWAESAGLDVWNLPKLERDVEVTVAQNKQLAVQDGDIQQRIAIKEVLVADLIAGRVSLAEVTAEFMALNQSRPEYMALIRDEFPGETDELKVAHNVINYARHRLTDRADRARVLGRLEAELAQMADSGSLAAE